MIPNKESIQCMAFGLTNLKGFSNGELAGSRIENLRLKNFNGLNNGFKIMYEIHTPTDKRQAVIML